MLSSDMQKVLLRQPSTEQGVAVQRGTEQGVAVQWGTVQGVVVQRGTEQGVAVQWGTVQGVVVQRGTEQEVAVQWGRVPEGRTWDTYTRGQYIVQSGREKVLVEEYTYIEEGPDLNIEDFGPCIA